MLSSKRLADLKIKEFMIAHCQHCDNPDACPFKDEVGRPPCKWTKT